MSSPILWITVPNGQGDGRLRASLVAMPFNLGDSPVPPAEWEDWTASVFTDNVGTSSLSFSVEFSTDKTQANRQVLRPVADSDVKLSIRPGYLPERSWWRFLFPVASVLPPQKDRDRFVSPTTHFSAKQCSEHAEKILLAFHTNQFRELWKAGLVEAKVQQKQQYDWLSDYAQAPEESDPLTDIRWKRFGDLGTSKSNANAKRSAFSTTFEKWIATQIQSADAETVGEARRAERNAYRLSRDPWNDLDDCALAAAWLAGLRDQKNDANLVLINNVLANCTANRLEALRMAITLGRVSDEKHIDQPLPSFSDKLAMLGSYPELLRKLGVILDIEFPSPTSSTIYECVRITVKRKDGRGAWMPLGVAPWTLLEEKAFYARPGAKSPLANGALNPDSYQLDIKNAEAYLLKAGAQAYSSNSASTPNSGPTATGGAIRVTMIDRAAHVQKARQMSSRFHRLLAVDDGRDLAKAALLKTDDMQDITYDMVVRGFVPFVSVNAGTYYSLCKRSERYEILKETLGSSNNPLWNAGVQDGFVSTGAATTHDSTTGVSSDSKKDLHVADTLLAWGGWSLSVPKTLQQVAIDEGETAPPEHSPIPADGPLVSTKMSVAPHSLPKLRYGDDYSFKLLCKDLGGNLRTQPDAAREEDDIPSTRFLRIEPIPPPEILLTEHLATDNSPGEQLTTLVVRQPDTGIEKKGESSRLVVPPRCSIEMAELCGMFDGKTPFNVGSFDQAAFDDGGAFPHDDNPEGQATESNDAQAGGTKNPIYRVRFDSPKPCQYLPDPYADGFVVSIRDLDTNQYVRFDQDAMKSTLDPQGVAYLRVDFYENREWPKAETCLLVLARQEEGKARITVGMESRFWTRSYEHTPGKLRALVIRVPQEKEVEISIQSWASLDHAKRMAIPYLQSVQLGKQFCQKYKAANLANVVSDMHNLFSDIQTSATKPARVLKLVHASPRPVHVPTIRIIDSLDRRQNQTFQEFENVELCVDRASTGRITLNSEWCEWIDNNDHNIPRRVAKHAPVCEAAIAPPYALPGNGMQKANDTPAKSCTEEPKADTGDHLCDTPYFRTRLHGTYKSEKDAATGHVRQDFGDTRYRSVDYHCVGATRFSSCYGLQPAPHRVDPKANKQVLVLNSATPPPPDIAFIAPLFRWSDGRGQISRDKKTEAVHRSVRQGGGCRIFLARPWYVTGDDERLGVITWVEPGAQWYGKQDTRNLVTRWGADPIWEADVASPGPGPSHLDGAFDDDSPWLELDGQQQEVIVNPVSVEFDETKNLWYADVWFNEVPSYFAFLRFSLVRYQPHSISGCRFSSIARAQFTQLMPDRCVSVTRTNVNGKLDKKALDIFLSGRLSNSENTYSLQVHKQLNSLVHDLWLPVSDEVLCDVPHNGELLAHWRLDASQYCGPLRFVVMEYESHLRDKTVGKDALSTTEPAQRMVFASMLEA